MLVRTSTDLGAVIRDRRKQLKLDQAAFAKKIGVGREWVIQIEKGHPRAELGLALRAIDALNIQLDASVYQGNQVKHRRTNPVDIDAIISKARKTKS
jgi:HTH-type transcriptional regulator / antitoxin HipB